MREFLLEIERLLYRELPTVPDALEQIRNTIGKAGELGLADEAVEVQLDFIVMQEVDREIHEYRAERPEQRGKY